MTSHHDKIPPAQHEPTPVQHEVAETRPLTGLYVSRKGRDGASDYMDGGWSVLGRQTVKGVEYTRVIKPSGIEDAEGKEQVYARDIPTDRLYEQHTAESERILAEQKAALGEGAFEAVLIEQGLEEAHSEPEQGQADEATQVGTEHLDESENLEGMMQDLNAEAAALEASLAANDLQRTKLRSDAGHVTQVLRTYVIDQLKRNMPVSPEHIAEIKSQMKDLLTQLETEKSASANESGLSLHIDTEGGEKVLAGSLKAELVSFANRLSSNRRNHDLAINSAHNSCGALVNDMLDQLQSVRFDGQLVATLEVAVGKIEQGIAGSESFNFNLKGVIKNLRATLSESVK